MSYEDLLEKASRFLDDHFFSARFEGQSDAYENAISTAIKDYTKVTRIERKIRPIKVYSALGSLWCAYRGLGCFLSGNLKCVFYFAIGFDLLHVSYNCYIKRYCALAGKKYFKLVGGKVISWIKSSLGLTNKEPTSTDESIALLNQEVNWDVIGENTFAKIIISKIQESPIIASIN